KVKNVFVETKLAKIEYYLDKGTEIVGIVYGDTEKATRVIDEIKLSLSTKEQAVFYMGISNEYTHFSHLRKSYLEDLQVVETSVYLNKEIVRNTCRKKMNIEISITL